MKIILFFITIAFLTLWRWNSPYPNPLNWDIWEHQTVVNAIRGGSYAIFPSKLTDTFQFDGYTTAFHTFIAGLQDIFQVQNVLGFWWIAEGIFFVLTSLAMYEFVRTLTKNKIAALAAGIISAGFFESAVAFTTLFLLPQTLAALIFMLGITAIVRSTNHKLLIAIITSLLILPIHAIVGALGALFLFIIALSPKIPWWIAFVITYTVATITGAFLGGLNSGEALYFNQTLLEKLALFRQWYGFLPIPFLILGVNKHRILTIILAISMGLILSPFPYALKFMVIIHPILISVMVLGMIKFLNKITVASLTIAVAMIFYSNVTIWKQPVIFRGIASHVSADEIAAARFLQNNYKDAFLVSDPATQYILEALSGVDSQGGAYMSQQTRKDLMQMNLKPGSIFAVSARTMKWLNSDISEQKNIAFNIWRPDGLSLNDNLKINEYPYQILYRNAGVVLLKI